jgi:methionine-gamma-lyase
MSVVKPTFGLSTLLTHISEGTDPRFAHVTPIYQTSTFRFPDVATGAALFKGEAPGYIYTRYNNPNAQQLADKLAYLEGLDLLRAHPELPPEEVVSGMIFGSGMAAISAAVMARVKAGQTIIAQKSIYGGSYVLLHDLAPQFGWNVVWVEENDLAHWEAAFQAQPQAVLAYAETPSNPTLGLVDLASVADLAHAHGAWLFVDNTFATPYCQRPLTLGADVVLHSTTKYISGHGQVVGGAVISGQVDFVRGPLTKMLRIVGGSAGPFDCWLTVMGLKTFELRMQRHCENAMKMATFLEGHPKVARVYYPGLEHHSDHELARRQMSDYGGMISFELKGGLKAGESLMNHVKVMTLAVSLGNVDTLIQHPASMSAANVSPQARLEMGITDGLVRLSVGIENIEDLIDDMQQGLEF